MLQCCSMIRDLGSLRPSCVSPPAAVVQHGGRSADGQQHQTGQELHTGKCWLTEATETQVTELRPDASCLHRRTAGSTTRWRSTTRPQRWSASCGEETTGSVLLLSTICLSAYLSACSSVCLFICLPVCLPVRLSACLPVHLSACSSVCLPACLSEPLLSMNPLWAGSR